MSSPFPLSLCSLPGESLAEVFWLHEPEPLVLIPSPLQPWTSAPCHAWQFTVRQQ